MVCKQHLAYFDRLILFSHESTAFPPEYSLQNHCFTTNKTKEKKHMVTS